jgi:hypothetical protein
MQGSGVTAGGGVFEDRRVVNVSKKTKKTWQACFM